MTFKLTSPELQKRRVTVIAALKKPVVKKEELAEGLKFTFPGGDVVLDQLIDFIKSERLCCDFFSNTYPSQPCTTCTGCLPIGTTAGMSLR